MIQLTKLDETRILLCLDNVKYIESCPDTIVFFTNGETLIVRESLEDIQKQFRDLKNPEQ